jgi:hypothetical protein
MKMVCNNFHSIKKQKMNILIKSIVIWREGDSGLSCNYFALLLSIFQRDQFTMLANGPLNPAFSFQVGQDDI